MEFLDVSKQTKYAPSHSRLSLLWAMFHFVSILSLLLLFLYYFGSLQSNQAMFLGITLFVSIFGYTSVMDRHHWSIGFEWFRIIGSGIVLQLMIPSSLSIIYWPWMTYLFISGFALIALMRDIVHSPFLKTKNPTKRRDFRWPTRDRT